MSAPVDVLAVMDQAAKRWRDVHEYAKAEAMTEVRAAVAKLIAAAGAVVQGGAPVTVRERQEMTRRLRVLSAALARVGGAA